MKQLGCFAFILAGAIFVCFIVRYWRDPYEKYPGFIAATVICFVAGIILFVIGMRDKRS